MYGRRVKEEGARNMIKKASKESLNPVDEKLSELKRIIPEVFTEGKIDFDKFQRTLGKEINGQDEKYSFNWAGRKETFKNIQTTTKGTLKPVEKESVNWDSTENLFIEGDNLEVLKLLQKAYFNRIKMIYIDPPYNTGNDLIYKDDFKNSIKSYLKQTGQLNGDGVKITTNPETSGRFHSDWISMMYPRLFIARNLLKDDGVIFISIDEKEVQNLRKIMDEIFGEENFISEIVVVNNIAGRSDREHIATAHEYVLAYQKSDEFISFGLPLSEKHLKEYRHKDNNGVYRIQGLRKRGSGALKKDRPKMHYPVYYDPKSKAFSLNSTSSKQVKIIPKLSDGRDGRWRWGMATFEIKKELLEARLSSKKGTYEIFEKVYLESNGKKKTTRLKSFLLDSKYTTDTATTNFKKLMGASFFTNPKPVALISDLIINSCEENEIILDFFTGSGTTAHSTLELNKNGPNNQFICVQLPEITDKKSEAYKAGFKTISDIAKERIKKVIIEIKNEQRNTKQKKLTEEKNASPDLGFKVFKLDQSNYKIWEKYEGKDEKELKKQLELFKSPLVSGYKEQDVIFECIIKEGYSLNSSIEKTSVKTNKVYKVTDGELFFYICLDQEVKDKTIDELKLKKDDMLICLDEALNDSKKKNLAIQCNLKTI
jgi:adenine-specific DNA-methyltransferase